MGEPLPEDFMRAAAQPLEPGWLRRLLRRPTATQKAHAEGRAEGVRMIAELTNRAA